MNIMYTTKYQTPAEEIAQCFKQVPNEMLDAIIVQLRTLSYGTEAYGKFCDWCNDGAKPELRDEYFETYLREVNDRLDTPVRFGVWLTPLELVLNRSYNLVDLCKEDKPVLRCFIGDHFTIICNMDNASLYGFSEMPKLQQDPLVNNKLITRAELEELLQYEKESGGQLAKTTTKKDVLHILKMGRNGLLNRKSRETTVRRDPVDISFEDRIRSLL